MSDERTYADEQAAIRKELYKKIFRLEKENLQNGTKTDKNRKDEIKRLIESNAK